jgi:YbgC/YbaW family acyl-CoA thioester hydrolase
VIEHVERRRVEWIDTDAGGRIHFTSAFRWAEAAETSLMQKAGLLGSEWGDFPRRHVEAEYFKVLRFTDEFDVRIRVEQLGTTSITYAWELVKDGDVYIAGQHTVVHVGANGRPKRLAEEYRSALAG